MVYTSYFANVRHLPSNVIPISIAAKCPSGFKGSQFKLLAPSFDILMDWKENGDNATYIAKYQETILYRYNATNIIKMLSSIAGPNKIPCLICYEKPEDFCHRHIVAEWLNKNGYECQEFSNK